MHIIIAMQNADKTRNTKTDLDEKPALVLKGERSQILDLKLHGQTPLILIAFSVRNTIKGSKL